MDKIHADLVKETRQRIKRLKRKHTALKEISDNVDSFLDALSSIELDLRAWSNEYSRRYFGKFHLSTGKEELDDRIVASKYKDWLEIKSVICFISVNKNKSGWH